MDALRLLKKEHADLKSLFTKFDRTGKTAHDRRSELFNRIRRELQIHSRAESEVFYAAVKSLNGDGRRLISQATKEHRQIDELLTQIARLKPSDRNFDEKIETLFENVDHHLEEEEGEIFQFAAEKFSEEQLDDLGRQIEERERTLSEELAA